MTLYQKSAGLDGVTAAVTALSHVDGEAGELIIAGSRVAELARQADFASMAARLLATAQEARSPISAQRSPRRG